MSQRYLSKIVVNMLNISSFSAQQNDEVLTDTYHIS